MSIFNLKDSYQIVPSIRKTEKVMQAVIFSIETLNKIVNRFPNYKSL